MAVISKRQNNAEMWKNKLEHVSETHLKTKEIQVEAGAYSHTANQKGSRPSHGLDAALHAP